MKAQRIFKGPDIDMMSANRAMAVSFESAIADFTAIDPSLNATFLADWKALREIVWGMEDDESEVLEGEVLMGVAQGALEKCQIKYIEVKYYAGRAFPNNKEARKEFGEGVYSKVRKSPLKMVQFMETLHGVATKYKTQLIAQHYTQAAIDEIATLTAELRTDNQAQQLKKKERPTETRNRIEQLNTYYGFGQRVAAVAPVVYRNDFVRRSHFLLAERQHPKVTKSWFTLPANSTHKTALPKLLKKFNVTLTNQSKETIDYWKADNINEAPAEIKQLTGGEVIPVTAEYPAKKFLVVENNTHKSIRVMLTKHLS